MTTVYKRPYEENAFKCHECNTVWKDSWLEVGERGWCPACGVENIPTELIKLKEPKKIERSKDISIWLKEQTALVERQELTNQLQLSIL